MNILRLRWIKHLIDTFLNRLAIHFMCNIINCIYRILLHLTLKPFINLIAARLIDIKYLSVSVKNKQRRMFRVDDVFHDAKTLLCAVIQDPIFYYYLW